MAESHISISDSRGGAAEHTAAGNHQNTRLSGIFPRFSTSASGDSWSIDTAGIHFFPSWAAD